MFKFDKRFNKSMSELDNLSIRLRYAGGGKADDRMQKDKLRTFEDLEVEITYDIYREKIDSFLLGAAIYTPSRDYIFRPNTYLEKDLHEKSIFRI